MINKSTVEECREELLRTLKRLDAVSPSLKEETSYPYPSPENAALKRASMDLSRALAKLRSRG